MERYNRNILIEKVGEEGQQKIFNAKILVAGAGGLGSTVILNLAAVGIGRIGVVDNDVLELSNLNRQYIHQFQSIGQSKVESAQRWIHNFNPDIEVEIYNLRLNLENGTDIISKYDLVIDCFDSYNSKFLLNELCVKNKKPLIHGGVTEFFGQVTTIIPDETPCLSCLIPDYNPEAYTVKGVISPAVSTIASIQSLEAVKLILNIGDNLKGILLSYNGLKQDFKKIKFSRNVNCKLCSKTTLLQR